jgi:speckle-type POZ protein
MGNRPSTQSVAAIGIGNQTSSTHRSLATAGVHQFSIKGHSVIAGSDEPITSKPFRVGGYEWTIRYYPNGADAETGGQHVSVFLCQNSPGDDAVTATFSFSCLQQDPASPTSAKEKNKLCSYTGDFSSEKSEWGPGKFMSKADLAASGCLKDDCLVIRCAVEVITKELTHDDDHQHGAAVVVVPPSDLTRDLGSLLASGHATDITVEIGEAKKFRAHRCVLAARSPVLRALLCSKRSSICIKDVDAAAFEILLHYMYHDDLPMPLRNACSKGTTDMAQRVIVATDRYGMGRLKLMCESKLSKMLDVDTVCSILDFADGNNCAQLKSCCFEYMLKDRKRLKDIANTQGFKKLNQNCLSIACEMLLKAL